MVSQDDEDGLGIRQAILSFDSRYLSALSRDLLGFVIGERSGL